MNELDKLLKLWASRPTPTPPANLEDAVWRAIRLREQAPGRESFFDWLASCVWRWRFAAPSATAALLFGFGLAWFAQNANATQPASRALNLQVFSEHPPTMRLTSL